MGGVAEQPSAASAPASEPLIPLTDLLFFLRLTEMEILYKKEKEEADQLLEQQRLVSPQPSFNFRSLKEVNCNFFVLNSDSLAYLLGVCVRSAR